uniref:beta-ketoacyl synthase N-terminal-like domain-containing protein n=1 Tax=Candidatus Stercorousia sp. TaxID=3048886 RepID=UPI004029E8C6
MNEIYITDACALFADKLTPDEKIVKGSKFYFGKLEKDFDQIQEPNYNLRCNRLLKFLVDKLDLSEYEKSEIGIIIGTTNSGIEEYETTENKHHAELGNPAEFLKWYLGTTNYAASVSTACTSGIKAFATAIRLLENNVCKAVIAGGVDTLASMPTYGFHALEVLSHEKTNPFSKNRNGISLGEGGALFLLTKKSDGIKILGIGETSDAYHSATPDPEGTQASIAIQKALDEAKLSPDDIDYINLHGT